MSPALGSPTSLLSVKITLSSVRLELQSKMCVTAYKQLDRYRSRQLCSSCHFLIGLWNESYSRLALERTAAALWRPIFTTRWVMNLWEGETKKDDLFSRQIKGTTKWLKVTKVRTFLLLFQVGRHQVVEEHYQLGVHGDADVVGELCHNAALHFGLAVGVWGAKKELFTCELNKY